PRGGNDCRRGAGAGRPDGADARARRRVGRRGPSVGAPPAGRGARLVAACWRAALHLQRARLAYVRRSRPRREHGPGRVRDPRRRLLLRRGERAGAGDLEPLVAGAEWRDEVPVEVARIEGPARELLAAERTALNFLCHLSGVATLTARYVAAADGGVAILDTRKTTPAMRALEKAAVAAEGGRN